MRLLIMIVGMVFLTAPGGSFAASSLATTIVPCRSHDTGTEARDRELEAKARKLMLARDIAALNGMKSSLAAALNHAPDVPSQPEHCGDTVVLYSSKLTDMLVVSAAVSQDPAMANVTVVQREPLPYAMLGFDLGWIYFEQYDFADAATWYEKGLRNNPDELDLTSEYSIALSYTGRNEEALALVDGYLAGHPLNAKDEARLVRKRAWALVELGRLDEGEAAYKRSLELEPGNETALNELKYIDGQRATKPAN